MWQSSSARIVQLRLWWSVVILIVLALALRVWQLHTLPPGLYYNEAFDGLDAHRIASGGYYPIYLPANNGREPLFIYLLALAVKLFGPTAYALRLTSALVGVLLIPTVYFAARTLLPRTSDRVATAAGSLYLAGIPALVAAAGIAVSFWHLSLSRLAFRVVLLPVLSALAVAFFWRAWSEPRRSNYVWSAVCLALAMYTYTAARLLPFVIVLFVAIELLVELWRRRTAHGPWPAIWRPRLQGLGIMLLVGVVLLAPLLWLFGSNPELLSARTGDVSVFTVAQTDFPGTPLQRIAHNLAQVAGNFYVSGDLNPRHNLPGRPVNDPLLAVLFTVGWLAALWRIRQPWARLLLIWLAVMLLPTVLSSGAPHALRAAGALPPLALLYGAGAAAIIGGVLRLGQRRAPVRGRTWLAPAVGLGLLAGVIVVSGAWTGVDYFVRWARLPNLGAEFDLDLQLAAEKTVDLLQTPGQHVLLPGSLFVQPQMAYALGKIQQQAAVPQNLSAADPPPAAMLHAQDPDPRASSYLLWQDGDRPQAAWIQPSPMETQTSDVLRSPRHQPGWPQVTQSELVDSSVLRSRRIRYPLAYTFANGMQLVGYEVEPAAASPGDAETPFHLTLFWKAANPTGDFDVFAHLANTQGIWQTDNGPIGRGFLLTWLDWLGPEAIAEDVRRLPVPAGMPPGKAFFETGLYRYQPGETTPTGERISVVDDQGQAVADKLDLGAVLIGNQAPQANLADLTSLGVRFDDRIELTGWAVRSDPQNPRQLLVDLGWKALDRSPTDYTAFVHLIDRQGQIITQSDAPPGGLDNPTRLWVPGETVRTAYSLELPAGLTTTGTRLRIGLYEPVSQKQLPITAAANPAAGARGDTYVLLPVE